MTNDRDLLREAILAEAAEREQTVLRLARAGDTASLVELALHLVRVDTRRRLTARRDPRTVRTERLALRIARAHTQGVGVAELQERFGISKASVYRLLAVLRDRKTFTAEDSGQQTSKVTYETR